MGHKFIRDIGSNPSPTGPLITCLLVIHFSNPVALRHFFCPAWEQPHNPLFSSISSHSLARKKGVQNCNSGHGFMLRLKWLGTTALGRTQPDPALQIIHS